MIADSNASPHWFEQPLESGRFGPRIEEEKGSQIAETAHPERHVFKIPTVHPFDDEKDTYANILIVDDNAFCLIAVVSLLA